MRRLGLVASVFLLLAAASAEAVQPGYEHNGRIAFASDRDGDYEIYSMKDDGTDLVKLTDNAGADLSPDWSPEGSRIVFTSDRDGDHDIYAMDADGDNVVQITNRPGYESGPVWSGFGTRIAFIAQTQNGEGIGFVNADGSGLDVPNGGAQYGGVSWSSDDTRLAFSLGDPFDPSFQVYTWNLASGTSEHITGGSHPDWSPDMSTVAFDAGDASDNADIWVVTPVQASGTTTRLTNDPGFDVAPRWSPDGQEITWMTSRDGNYEIYKMHQDGTSPVRLTNHSGSDVWPDWQPVQGPPLSGYPRPRGATPVRVALVPAYRACTSPSLNHGPPLSFPSCAPQQRSPHITVGTPDANGSPAESTGSVRLDALVGAPGPPEDSDVLVTTAIDDVRCAGLGSPCPQAECIRHARLRRRGTDGDHGADHGPLCERHSSHHDRHPLRIPRGLCADGGHGARLLVHDGHVAERACAGRDPGAQADDLRPGSGAGAGRRARRQRRNPAGHADVRRAGRVRALTGAR